MWYDAGGAHVYKDQVSEKTGPAATKMELLVQQPVFLNTFPADIFSIFKNGARPYIPGPYHELEPFHGTTLRFANYAIRDFRVAFENILRITLENGDYNADESVLQFF